MIEMIREMMKSESTHPPVARLIGFRIVECSEGQSKLTLKTSSRHYNPMGTVHGGVLCDVADAAMGLAFASTLDDGESFTTIDLQMSYLRPVWETTLSAVARVVKRGRTIGYTECEVFDEHQKLVAKGMSHCLVLRGDAATGR